MRKSVLLLAVLGLASLSGCASFLLDSGPRYDVSVETVSANDSEVRVVAIEPR